MVVVASSAGGISALKSFLCGLPACFPAPIIIAQHLCSRKVFESDLDRVLGFDSRLAVKWAENGEKPMGGTAYLAPQDQLTVIDPCGGFLSTTKSSGLIRITRTADPLFKSAAKLFGPRALAIVLSGRMDDGAAGAAEIARAGGRVLVQSFESTEFDGMPKAAARQTGIALAFDPRALAHAAVTLVMAPGAAEWFRVGNGSSSTVHSACRN